MRLYVNTVSKKENFHIKFLKLLKLNSSGIYSKNYTIYMRVGYTTSNEWVKLHNDEA